MRKGPEAMIQKSVLDYLTRVLGLYFFRRNTGVSIAEYKGRKRLIRYGAKGQSDCWGILPNGVHVEIEIKAPGKTLTPEQQSWLDEINNRGGHAFWCTSVEQCETFMRLIYEAHGLPWNHSWDL